jgi:hypothetical protein
MFAFVLTCALLAPVTPVAANDICPVTGQEVRNHYLHHYVTIQGRKYYVQDRAAANLLRNCPQCYLQADGSLKRQPAAAPQP